MSEKNKKEIDLRVITKDGIIKDFEIIEFKGSVVSEYDNKTIISNDGAYLISDLYINQMGNLYPIQGFIYIAKEPNCDGYFPILEDQVDTLFKSVVKNKCTSTK